MAFSGLLRRVALVRADVSQELRASFMRVTTIGELGTTLAVTSTRRTLRRNIILHSYRREKLKSYIVPTFVIRMYSSSLTADYLRRIRYLLPATLIKPQKGNRQ
jgi:hypothetical protein